MALAVALSPTKPSDVSDARVGAFFSEITGRARMDQTIGTHKVEQLVIATVGFFWCFLMWFSTAAFSPSIAAHYHLGIKALGLLASSAMWMAPVGRMVAGWAADRFGAPRAFALVLAICGFVSIASAYTASYSLLFVERVIVAAAGVTFVIGIQHVAQW